VLLRHDRRLSSANDRLYAAARCPSISHLNVVVDDIDVATEFYGTVLLSTEVVVRGVDRIGATAVVSAARSRSRRRTSSVARSRGQPTHAGAEGSRVV
jgi:hypothetical protein